MNEILSCTQEASGEQMIQEIKREYAGLSVSVRELRTFGFLLSGLFGTWSIFLIWNNGQTWSWYASASALFFVAGLLFPIMLQRIYRAWMLFAIILGWFATRIILTIAYATIMTPIGWVMRMSDKDLLDERIEMDLPSYWKKHEPAKDREQYKKQY